MDYHHYMHNLSHRFMRSKIFFGLEILISTVLGITLIFPILGSLLVLNEVIRYCVKIYLRLVYEDSVMLSDDECGSNYIHITSKDRPTVLYLGELEGTLDVENIRENYQKHVIENKIYAKLTYVWEKRSPYICMKKCENFDIKNHIRYYPGTEERTVRETELMKEILPELSKGFGKSENPQWEEVIIPYYEKPPSMLESGEGSGEDECETEDKAEPKTISLRIIRMHHYYMDGASTLLMIANTFTKEGNSFPYVIDPCKPLKISKLSMFLYKLTSVALFSTTMLRNLVMPPFLRTSRFSVKPDAKGKVLFGWTRKIPMDVFQNIKEKSGVSMPAIVSTVLSSAIRKLEIKYPHTQGNINYLDNPAYVPDTHPLWIVAGIFPYAADKPGNEHIVIETQVNTADISGCQRLAIMNDDLGRLAKNPTVTVNYWCVKMLGRAPNVISEIFLSLASCPAILSNIPLCTRNIKMWGTECYSIVGWVPLLANSGLGVVSVRYADHFRYCIQVDSTAVNQEELDYFISQIEQQAEELFLETAQLKRKISTEASLFQRQNAGASSSTTDPKTTDSTASCDFETDDVTFVPDTCLNNNIISRQENTGFSIGGAINSVHYSFIFRLKDSFEQIKDGIRKIKEQ